MLRIRSWKYLLATAALMAVVFYPATSAFADDFTYTFSGTGSGTISGNTNAAFSDAAFNFTFVEDTANVISNGTPGFWLLSDISGSFTEGSYSTTITDAAIEDNGNGSMGGNFETVFLFDGTSSVGSIGIFDDGELLGYALVTPISVSGTDPGAGAGAFQPSSGYSTTTGDMVQFTGIDSLTFTAAPVGTTPEPSSLILLATGISGIVTLRKRLFR
jgi:hypothetical protein